MVADKIPFGLITLFFGWMTWHAQPSTDQTLQPFMMAATQFTNLWLLTGLGQYVLYRAAPDPQAWGQAARLAIIICAVLVWALPLLFVWNGAAAPRFRLAMQSWNVAAPMDYWDVSRTRRSESEAYDYVATSIAGIRAATRDPATPVEPVGQMFDVYGHHAIALPSRKYSAPSTPPRRAARPASAS